jgi:hypothetical protein
MASSAQGSATGSGTKTKVIGVIKIIKGTRNTIVPQQGSFFTLKNNYI